MDKVVKQLQKDYPDLSFSSSNQFYWSPKNQTVYFKEGNTPRYLWTLLHETSHGVLRHKTFGTDFELLQIEIAAWENAKDLGKKYSINIDIDHIENCLDTYRDWLHKRSTCPNCSSKGLQVTQETYQCVNCSQEWQVSENRFCRPYRARTNKKAP